MEVLGYVEKGTINGLGSLPGGYRRAVMNKFSELLSKYNDVLMVETNMRFDGNGNVVPPEGYESEAHLDSNLDCFCQNRSNAAPIYTLGCCGKPVHVQCLIDYLRTMPFCMYCSKSLYESYEHLPQESIIGDAPPAEEEVASVVEEVPAAIEKTVPAVEEVPAAIDKTAAIEKTAPVVEEVPAAEDAQAACAAIIKRRWEDNVRSHAAAVAAIEKTAPGVEEAATEIEKTLPVVEEAAAAIEKTPVKEDEITDDDIRTFLGVDGKSAKEYETSVEDMTRKIAMDMKRNMQEASAEKETKRRGDAMMADGLGVGAVVTVKVDYRTHSHAQGLVAIVYKYTETGSAIVCCESGVLTHDGSSKDYYVPSDKFKINAGAGESAVIPRRLNQVREDIMNGVYDYKNMPRISYSKFHQECVQAESPCKRNVCGCKGHCTARCGCRRKGLDCTSTCGCSGNCNWRDAK
jgi:hypothetical protein